MIFILLFSCSSLTDAPAPNDPLETAVVCVIDLTSGRSYGTGVIIDTLADGVLVLTALHVVEPGRRLRVAFNSSHNERLTSEQIQVIIHQRDADLAILAVRTTHRPIKVPTIPSKVQADQLLESWGWKVNGLEGKRQEQYLGVSLIRREQRRVTYLVTDGSPIHGRSGGPLFSSQGELIGICRGGYPAEKGHKAETLYAGLEEIQAIRAELNGSDGEADRDIVKAGGNLSHR